MLNTCDRVPPIQLHAALSVQLKIPEEFHRPVFQNCSLKCPTISEDPLLCATVTSPRGSVSTIPLVQPIILEEFPRVAENL